MVAEESGLDLEDLSFFFTEHLALTLFWLGYIGIILLVKETDKGDGPAFYSLLSFALTMRLRLTCSSAAFKAGSLYTWGGILTMNFPLNDLTA
jgi:hypothetical protein